MSGHESVSIEDSSFDEIRKRCLESDILFEDEEFPPTLDSIYHKSVRSISTHAFKWMRPTEICKYYGLRPSFFLDGGSRFDLIQGEIGNCWVVAAAASLSEDERLLHRVVPRNQSFNSDWYAGIFHFRFWQYGSWVEVIVDDRLPTVFGKLMFVHSNHANEFWGALLEKAFAKLHGSYEALIGGTNAEALRAFTGGLVESCFLPQSPHHFERLLQKAFERRSVVAASIYFQGSTVNDVLPSGLVIGHAYSVTAIEQVEVLKRPIYLLRIRNPWGNNVEWKGAWSDNSSEWKHLSTEDRYRMKLKFLKDGEFWMELKDFVKHFDSVEICNLTADALLDPPKTWSVSIIHSQWTGESAGGSIRFQSFWKNPQVHLKVDDHDEDNDQMASFTVELTHKEPRKKMEDSITEFKIGFAIFKIDRFTSLPLKEDFAKRSKLVGMSDFYVTRRTVTKRFLLPPGEYIIIPTTEQPNQEMEFSLRIFSEAKHSSVLNDSTDINELEDDPEKIVDSHTYALQKYFNAYAGPDNAADTYEVKKLLDYALQYEKYGHLQFKYSTCKYLVLIMDIDFSKKLEFQEFLQLWFKLKEWLKLFVKYDLNKDGTISSENLEKSLNHLGYNFDSKMIEQITFRYSDSNKKVSFNDFVKCLAKLHMSFVRFKRDVFYDVGQPNIVDKWLKSLIIL